MELVSKVLVTLGVALLIALVQTLLKGVSRSNRDGRNHGLAREDLLFWSDWTVAAAVALIVSIAVPKEDLEPLLVVGAFVYVIGTCTAFPFMLKVFAYESNAQIKPMRPGGYGWIIVANVGGIAALFLAIVLGAEIYEFG